MGATWLLKVWSHDALRVSATRSDRSLQPTSRKVDGEFDLVPVGILDVKAVGPAVIGCAYHLDAALAEPLEGLVQLVAAFADLGPKVVEATRRPLWTDADCGPTSISSRPWWVGCEDELNALVSNPSPSLWPSRIGCHPMMSWQKREDNSRPRM